MVYQAIANLPDIFVKIYSTFNLLPNIYFAETENILLKVL